MSRLHERLTALETRVAAICKAEKDAEDAAGTFRELIERLASRIHPPADPETLELVATGDTADILESAEACRVASMIAALLANGEDE